MATTRDVISILQGRGITLEPDGAGGLRVIGASRLTDRDKALLKEHKASILKALVAANDPPVAAEAVTAPLLTRPDPPEPGSTTPFDQEALDAVKAGAGCWVWSGVLAEWMFVVRDDERKAKAISRGIYPGCIWTLAEVTGVQGMPPEGLRDIAAIKRKFAGAIVPREVPARWRDVLEPLGLAVDKHSEGGPGHEA